MPLSPQSSERIARQLAKAHSLGRAWEEQRASLLPNTRAELEQGDRKLMLEKMKSLEVRESAEFPVASPARRAYVALRGWAKSGHRPHQFTCRTNQRDGILTVLRLA